MVWCGAAVVGVRVISLRGGHGSDMEGVQEGSNFVSVLIKVMKVGG
jgi:hypothetical protein